MDWDPSIAFQIPKLSASCAFCKFNIASRLTTTEGLIGMCCWGALDMLLDELQVHIRVNQDGNKDHVAQKASVNLGQIYGSSPGHREVKHKNRRDLKSRKNNTEPQPQIRKPWEGAMQSVRTFCSCHPGSHAYLKGVQSTPPYGKRNQSSQRQEETFICKQSGIFLKSVCRVVKQNHVVPAICVHPLAPMSHKHRSRSARCDTNKKVFDSKSIQLRR